MTDEVELLLSLPRSVLVERLPAFVRRLIEDPEVGDEVARGVERVAAALTDEAWDRAGKRLAGQGTEYGAYPPEPAARDLTAAFLDPLLTSASGVEGLEHLDAARDRAAGGGRVLIVGNHTSYADTTTAAHLLRRLGRGDAADRIAVLAGPKVFEDSFRRFASAAVGAIKVAQSSRLAHNTAELSARDVAKIARRCLDITAELMDSGTIVLLYAEGTRSRDGRLQPFVRATARYATLPDTTVLPLAQTGANEVMRVGQRTFRRATVRLRFAPLIEPATRTRPEALEAIHRAIEAHLPPESRPGPDAPRIH